MLLEPDGETPARVDVGWQPDAIATSPVRVGTAFWMIAGLCVLVASWAVLSIVSFLAALLAVSLVLGMVGVVGVGIGAAMLLHAALLEIRAYRSLGNVDRLRAVLASSSTTTDVARAHGLAWLNQVAASIPDRAAVERLLRGATTTAEIRSILRSQVADRLREAATGLGVRGAIEGATLVTICPHPAWDGVIAGGRGLVVIRQVAALYGMRPGLVMTLVLVRKVAWTAVGIAGVDAVSQEFATQLLHNTPALKHIAGAIPGGATLAMRLYRLAGATAETCSPVH